MSEKQTGDIPQLAQDDRPVWERIAELAEKLPKDMVDQWNEPEDARLALALAENQRLREALRRIAFEPFGHAEASDREVLNDITEYARAALTPPATEAGKESEA